MEVVQRPERRIARFRLSDLHWYRDSLNSWLGSPKRRNRLDEDVHIELRARL
jgi:hypothetical protein